MCQSRKNLDFLGVLKLHEAQQLKLLDWGSTTKQHQSRKLSQENVQSQVSVFQGHLKYTWSRNNYYDYPLQYFVLFYTLMSMSSPSTGLKGLWIDRWKFNCSISNNSLFKIISVAFSLSPLRFPTNCWIETLNSSTLQAKYIQVTLEFFFQNKTPKSPFHSHDLFGMMIHDRIVNVETFKIVECSPNDTSCHWRLEPLAEVPQPDLVSLHHDFFFLCCEKVIVPRGLLQTHRSENSQTPLRTHIDVSSVSLYMFEVGTFSQFIQVIFVVEHPGFGLSTRREHLNALIIKKSRLSKKWG